MVEPNWGDAPAEAVQNRILFVEDAGCVTQLYRPAAGILFCRIAGHFSVEHARQLADTSSFGTAGDNEIHYYCDWELMADYASEARKTMTDWGRQERGRLKTGLYICGTRIVEMGVNVAGAAMALLGIRIRAVKRPTFCDELTTQLRETGDKAKP